MAVDKSLEMVVGKFDANKRLAEPRRKLERHIEVDLNSISYLGLWL